MHSQYQYHDSAGDSFCAGADLSNPPNPLEQSSDLFENLLKNPVYQMSRIQIPIIGALKGYVITGGFELALACDILIGDETTKFRDSECTSKILDSENFKLFCYFPRLIYFYSSISYSWLSSL